MYMNNNIDIEKEDFEKMIKTPDVVCAYNANMWWIYPGIEIDEYLHNRFPNVSYKLNDMLGFGYIMYIHVKLMD